MWKWQYDPINRCETEYEYAEQETYTEECNETVEHVCEKLVEVEVLGVQEKLFFFQIFSIFCHLSLAIHGLLLVAKKMANQ